GGRLPRRAEAPADAAGTMTATNRRRRACGLSVGRLTLERSPRGSHVHHPDLPVDHRAVGLRPVAGRPPRLPASPGMPERRRGIKRAPSVPPPGPDPTRRAGGGGEDFGAGAGQGGVIRARRRGARPPHPLATTRGESCGGGLASSRDATKTFS